MCIRDRNDGCQEKDDKLDNVDVIFGRAIDGRLFAASRSINARLSGKTEMASQTTSKNPVKPQTKVQTYVNRQLDRTRRRVKSTELITRLIIGVLLVLAMLQVFAVVDAWVWSFNPTARWICFLALVGAVVVYGVLAVAPLFLRKIHTDLSLIHI